MPNFTDLPTELLSQVLDLLSFEDLKALRFVSHHCSLVCASLLFRCVRISRLKRHHDAFFAIADRPHLAQAVHKLVWEELDIDACEETGAGLNWRRQTPGFALDNDESNIHQLFNDAKTDPAAFWLPRGPYFSEEPTPEDLVENRAFNAAHNTRLADFAELFHAALQKMVNLKTFVSCQMPPNRSFNYQGYEMRADTFFVEQTVTRRSGNLGLRQFLLPELSSFPDITGLQIGTELTTMFLFDFWYSKTYQNLTSLDLCIADNRPQPFHDIYQIFMATPSLVSLKLCFERFASISGVSFPTSSEHLPELEITDRAPKTKTESADGDVSTAVFWPHLSTLHLVDVRLPNDFDMFLGKHASSLRALVLDCCRVNIRHVAQVRRNSCLKLSSVRILDEGSAEEVAAEDLVAYINNETDDCLSNGKHISVFGPKVRLATESSIFDHQTCPGSAYFESRRSPARYDDTDLYAIHGSLNVPADIDVGPEDNPETDDDDDKMDGLLDYKAYKARRGQVYWDWCYHNDTWYWWPIDSTDSAKTNTSSWKFISRDGGIAYGPEPLAFFDDWDSDAGDVAEPTPFGPAFDQAYKNPLSAAGAPPEGAEVWTAHDLPSFLRLGDEAWRPSPGSVYNIIYQADQEMQSSTDDEGEEDEAS